MKDCMSLSILDDTIFYAKKNHTVKIHIFIASLSGSNNQFNVHVSVLFHFSS